MSGVLARPQYVQLRRWLVACARFETPGRAREAFDAIARELGIVDNDEAGVGYYRHGTPRGPAHFVSIVGLEHGAPNQRLERARALLERYGGRDERLAKELAEALIMRRVQQVRDYAGPMPSRAVRRGARR